MSLKENIASLHKYLACISKDLNKAERGNKAAAQRVRTCSIKFEKAAKKYRKESVAAQKKGLFKKSKAKPKRKAAKRRPAKKAVRRKSRRRRR